MVLSSSMRPEVRKLARALLKLGLRVTSIFRPDSSSHGLGIALDVTSIDYRIGEYDRETAAWLVRFAKRVAPGTTWAAASEPDHVHIELLNPDLGDWAGVKAQSGTSLSPLETGGTSMNRYSRTRPFEGGNMMMVPYGDANALIRASERGAMIDSERGQISGQVADQAGRRSVQPRVHGHQHRYGGRMDMRGMSYPVFRDQADEAAENLGDIGLQQVQAIRTLTGPATCVYVFAKNARLISSTLGPAQAALTATEARSCAQLVSGGLPIPVRIVPVPVVGPLFQFDAPDLAFVTNTQFNYVGQMLQIFSSYFNAIPGLPFQINMIPLGVPGYLNQTFIFEQMDHGEFIDIMILLGTIVSGTLQFAPAVFNVGGVPTPAFRWQVIGPPVATYFTNARYVVRGDSQINEFLQLMGF